MVNLIIYIHYGSIMVAACHHHAQGHSIGLHRRSLNQEMITILEDDVKQWQQDRKPRLAKAKRFRNALDLAAAPDAIGAAKREGRE